MFCPPAAEILFPEPTHVSLTGQGHLFFDLSWIFNWSVHFGSRGAFLLICHENWLLAVMFWGHTGVLLLFFPPESLGVGCGNEVVVNEEGWEDDSGWQEQRWS